jgi:hypothetical protein
LCSLSSLVRHLPNHCRCRGLLLCLITLRHTTLGRTPLDEGSVRRRDLYLTTHNTHNRQTSIPAAGFEPATPASERPQTHALDRADTEIGVRLQGKPYCYTKKKNISVVTSVTKMGKTG